MFIGVVFSSKWFLQLFFLLRLFYILRKRLFRFSSQLWGQNVYLCLNSATRKAGQ